MNRREFIEKSGCGMGCLVAAPAASQTATQNQNPILQVKPPQYKMEIEIFEARQDTWCHKKGDKFEYPKDMAKVCPWLMASMHDMLVLMQRGVTLPWKYEGTPYEKAMDLNGVSTEFVRCPDPTANLVAKIVRTKVG
jgi:uncharacterized repeat protein (TIGR04076 family)